MGVARVIHSIAEETAKHGVESRVLALASNPPEHPLRIGQHQVHLAKRTLSVASMDVSLQAPLLFATLAHWADIIHYHFPWPVADLLHILGRPRRPSVVTYHSDIVRQRFLRHIYQPVMHRFLRSVDCIVATSPNYVASSPVLQNYSDKLKVIPIGLPDLPPPRPQLVEEWRQRAGSDFFLFVGALRYYKGLDYMISAAKETGLPVIIAGSGQMEGDLRRQSHANIKLIGSVSEEEKSALLALCKAFVFPSHLRSEAFGVALLEAARSGKPMISCEIGTGTSYVNIDGVTGITVPPADFRAIGEAMVRLSEDPETTRRLGGAARVRYEQLFRAEEVCVHYLNLYRELAPKRPRLPSAFPI